MVKSQLGFCEQYLNVSIGEREGERGDRSHLGRELWVHERRWCSRWSTERRRGRVGRLEREGRGRLMLLRLGEGGCGGRGSREEG